MTETGGARATATRDAIISAARDLIRSNGVEGMSISQVVATSGTSTGAIYHHFGNKEQLVLAVGKSAIAVPMTMVMRTTPGISPAGLCEAALMRVAEDDRMPNTLLQIWSGAQSNPDLAALLAQETTLMRRSVEAFITPWMRENAPTAGVDAVVSLLFGLIAGYAVQRALGLEVDIDTYRNSALDAVRLVTGEGAALVRSPDE